MSAIAPEPPPIELDLVREAFDRTAVGLAVITPEGVFREVNRAFCAITGYERDDVLGRQETEVRNALQPHEYYDELLAVAQREGYWSGTSWARRRNGSVYREWRSIRAVRSPEGVVTHWVHVFYEVTGQRGESAPGMNPAAPA